MTRRRQLVTTVVAVAVLLGGCRAGGADPSAVPSVASAPTSSAPAAPTTAPSATSATAWVGGLPVGRPPAVGYVIGHTYHSPDGRSVRLLRDHGVASVVRLGDGFLVTSDQYFEGTTGLYRLDGRGRVLGSGTVASPPVLDAEGRTVHWLTFTPRETGLEGPTLLHRGDVVTGAVTSTEVAVSAGFLTSVVGAAGGGVLLRTGWGGPGAAWVHDGGRPRRDRRLDGAALLHPGAGLVAARRGRDQGALGVVDLTTGDLLWRAAGTYPVAFSPSGRHLLAYEGRRLIVLDARTGELSRLIPRPAYRRGAWLSEQLRWEDERHLLAGVGLRHRTAVVRVDVATGHVATAVDWTPTGSTYGVVFETVP